MISASNFEYPTQSLSDAFSTLSFRIRNDMGLAERRECLINIQSSPLDTLEGLGIMGKNLFMEFVAAWPAIKEKTGETWWKPKLKKHLDFLLARKSAMGNFDPHSFGKLMREFSEEQVNKPFPKKRRKKRK
jgi:hypothetical protein